MDGLPEHDKAELNRIGVLDDAALIRRIIVGGYESLTISEEGKEYLRKNSNIGIATGLPNDEFAN